MGVWLRDSWLPPSTGRDRTWGTLWKTPSFTRERMREKWQMMPQNEQEPAEAGRRPDTLGTAVPGRRPFGARPVSEQATSPVEERATLPSAHASALAAGSPPSPPCWPPAPSSFSHSAPLSGLGHGTATAQRDTAFSQKRSFWHLRRAYIGRTSAAPGEWRAPPVRLRGPHATPAPVRGPPALGNKYTSK